MTDIQRRAIASGFLHALQTSPDLFTEWHAIPKDDASAIGGLIQRTMGLSTAPSADDLHAMASYIDASLGDQVNALRAAQPTTPHHVGIVMLMQQNS